MPISTVCW